MQPEEGPEGMQRLLASCRDRCIDVQADAGGDRTLPGMRLAKRTWRREERCPARDRGKEDRMDVHRARRLVSQRKSKKLTRHANLQDK